MNKLMVKGLGKFSKLCSGCFFGCVLSLGAANAAAATANACTSYAETRSKKHMQICKNYVTGFIEGALLTDAAIIESLGSEKSNFLQRVYENRAIRSKNKVPPTYFAKFCLPEPLTMKPVVNKVLRHLRTSYAKEQNAATNVYGAFKTHFPCEQGK